MGKDGSKQYEVTFKTNAKEDFGGLVLATQSGVLNKAGAVSVDEAMALAERLADIKLEEAQASSDEDKFMIDELVRNYEGGFTTVNRFVRGKIREALSSVHDQHTVKFDNLIQALQQDDQGSIKEANTSMGTLVQRMQKRCLNFEISFESNEKPHGP